ncbi:hypothetical protein [Rhizobium sp. RM]|uniref:hypothetical protein n=1 Tax=Rhizobium sp. RM TaxID=2748079 RepID=UPI00110DA0A1|nr:hypothetical protein [Rhizobium sp. RM]NWJ24777.1 hypothetical protein [Rhizobium sp. RM]TMV16575.1 hypothetical protein BJG94_19260 [Rhizobium sp. Td3]
MPLTAAEVFRDFETEGVPSSGPHQPRKPEIRTLLKQYETIISAFTASGGFVFVTKAALDADLTHVANSSAWVIGDAVVANNGVYRKIGAPGSGSWSRVADLPYSFIFASNTGDGDPNAIEATTSIPVSASALVLLPVSETNTASPVTVSFNDGAVLTIKTNSANDVAVGGLVSGMLVMGVVTGAFFRIVTDQVATAIVAAAEAALQGALDARDAALTAVPNVFPATVPEMAALDPSNKLAAYLLAAGREGQFKKVNWSDVSTVGAVDTANGMVVRSTSDNTKAWARVNTEGWLNPLWFGAKGNGVDNDSAAIEAAMATVGDGQRATILLPPGKNFRLTDDVDVPPGKIIKFMGLGAETSLVTVNGAIDGFIQDNTAGTTLTSGIEFSNFRLAGSGGALRGICAKGGGVPGGTDARCHLIHINNMHISGFGEAIRLEKATNFLLTDMFLFGNGFGVRTLNAGDGKVTGVKTGSNTLGAFYIEGGAGGAWDEGFNIHGCHLNGDVVGVVFKNMFYCWLVSTQVGSTTNGTVQIDNADNCTLIGNEISNTLGNADGLVFLNSPDRAIVKGNFINGCRNYGAVITGSRHVISGNIFNGNGANSGRDLQLSNVAGAIIDGNRLLSTPLAANSIEEAGASDYNIISLNNCAKAIVKVGANTITPNNIQNAP